MTDNQFPVLDFDRGDMVDLTGQGDMSARIVLREASVTARVDETDEWVDMPIRVVMIDSAGPAIEIGPFSFTGRELAAIGNAIGEYATRFPDDLRFNPEARS